MLLTPLVLTSLLLTNPTVGKVENVVKIEVVEPKPIEVVVPAPVPPPPKVITAEDNPMGCNQDIQWISAEPPFNCINKTTYYAPDSSGNLYDYHSCTWWVKYNRPSIPNSWGDAVSWLYNAQVQGYATGSIPKAGAVGWVYGHVVYVVSVEGATITIAEGNYDYMGSYRVRTALATDFYYIY